jgi:hypothetical protein
MRLEVLKAASDKKISKVSKRVLVLSQHLLFQLYAR